MGTSNFYIPSSGPKAVRYLFIDGPFFIGLFNDCFRSLGITSEAIFYDALPIKKDNQTESEYRDLFDKKRDFLNELRRLPNMHVRDGYTRNRPRAGNRIEQKGVDTWIAVDALQYALRGTINIAEVITSDLDLYPLFEALLQTNTRGVLTYDADRTSDELIYAADQAKPIRLSQISGWLENNDRPSELSVARNGNHWNSANKIDVPGAGATDGEFRYDADSDTFTFNFNKKIYLNSPRLWTLVRTLNEDYKCDFKYVRSLDNF